MTSSFPSLAASQVSSMSDGGNLTRDATFGSSARTSPKASLSNDRLSGISEQGPQDAKQSAGRAKIWILLAAEGIIVGILALHGITWSEPVRGRQWKKSADSLNDAISELTSSIADDSYWSGTAAEAYNDLVEQLITQLQIMREADLCIHETLAYEADHVVYARCAIGAAAALVTISIPIALSMEPATSYEFQGSVFALTVAMAVSTAAAMALVAQGDADTISEQTAIYNAAAAAVQAASGSSSGTSDSVSVDTDYVDQLADQLTTAQSDVGQAASDVDGLVDELRATHGVVCQTSIKATHKAQRAYENACGAVEQRIDDTSTTLTDTATTYENTDEQQRFNLSDQISESEVARFGAASDGTSEVSAFSARQPAASLTGLAADRGSERESTDGTDPTDETTPGTTGNTTPVFAPLTSGHVGRASQPGRKAAAPAENAAEEATTAGTAPEEAALLADVDAAGAVLGAEGAERAPVDVAAVGAEGTAQPRPAERIA